MKKLISLIILSLLLLSSARVAMAVDNSVSCEPSPHFVRLNHQANNSQIPCPHEKFAKMTRYRELLQQAKNYLSLANNGNTPWIKTRVKRSKSKWVKYGGASYYANKFHGRLTASGTKFSQNKLTAAHRTLRFGTRVKVTYLRTGRTVKVVINDRGPFIAGRIIDLSRRAAKKIGLIKRGHGRVRLEKIR